MPDPENQKQKRWNEAAERLNHIDVGNIPIDKHIRETIVALNVFDIPTTASCGGHLENPDNDAPYLFVQNVEDPPEDEPEDVKKAWLRKNEILAEKVKSLLEEFNSGRPESKYMLYLRDIGQPGYRIESGAEKEWKAMEARGETRAKMNSKAPELITGARAEFAAFTDFLRTKHFG